MGRAKLSKGHAKVPTHLIFVTSSVFHYLGPSFAVILFGYLPVLGVAWLRIATAAATFAIWRKPWRTVLHPLRIGEISGCVGLGATFAAMNSFFYLAISRIPLATVGAIEFLAPVAMAAAGVRSLRNLVALSAASLGAFSLSEIQLSQEPLALAFALANCALFGCYIALGHRFAQQGSSTGINRVGLSMMFALVFMTPVGISGASSFLQPVLLAAGIGVGICSSVLSYVLDQFAMSRLPRATFALLLSILPAMATIIGAVVLRQLPTPGQLVGILLIIGGVAFHQPMRDSPGANT
ncbi:MAG: EamA family transporter [archaeon]|nr:MAG: EamA family transporter [archaeon]